jgi:peroxiredoxin
MRASRYNTRTLAGLTLGAAVTGLASAQQRADDVLARKPVQASAAVTTPTGAELAGCKAEPVAWPKQASGPTPTGVVVKDAQGRTVRQFIDTTGRNRPNIFSYFLNGVEAYREIDGNGNGKPDQFRWLGPNGTKWGADAVEDGTVDSWYILSAEEASQEAFAALAAKDARKFQALLPTEAELKAAGVVLEEITKITAKTAGAMKKFQDAATALALSDKAKWVHVEFGLPMATPEAVGGRDDLVRHRSATVLFDKGDGKSADVFQTGELVLVGRAWKLVEGPSPGGAVPTGDGSPGSGTPLPAKVQELITKLNAIAPVTDPAAMPKYHTDRAAVLEQIVAELQGADQEPWLKQVIDAYASAAEFGAADGPAMARVRQWRDNIEQAAPKSSAAAYAAFRVTSAEYALKLGEKSADVTKVQAWWKEQLESYLGRHPAGEEAPEAMLRLAVAHEFAGKDGEAQAKTWYEKLVAAFPQHPYAAKAQGAVRRLTSEGQPLALPAGPALDGKAFNPADLTGKVTVVYYWASWGRDATGELKQLAELVKTYGAKGLQVVTISLDDESAKATAALQAAQLPGTHLHQPGGLDRSPLAVAYGIQMVPHILLVGKDGKVVSRNAQSGPLLKDEIEKLTK